MFGGFREGQAPPLRKGRGKHRLPSCRSADGHQAPFPVGAFAPSGRNAGRQHRGRECVMGPQPEPSVSGSGWERPIPPVRGKWPKAKGGRDEQGSGRSFRRPGGNGAKRTLRGRGAPAGEKTVPSGRPRKPGVRGDGVEIEGGTPPENRFTIAPRRLFRPFLAGQKGTLPSPVKT